MKRIIFAINCALALQLSSCAVIAVGVVGVSAYGVYQVSYRKGPKGLIEDMQLTRKVNKAWKDNGLVETLCIVMDDRIMLCGYNNQVGKYMEVAKTIPGVKKIIDATREQSAVGAVMDDQLLAARIKSFMIANKNIQSRNYATMVYAGVVYMIGSAYTQEEKDAVIECIGDIPGVQGLEHDIEVVPPTSKSQMLPK